MADAERGVFMQAVHLTVAGNCSGPSSEVKLNSASMVLVIERAAGEPAEHDRRHDAELAQ